MLTGNPGHLESFDYVGLYRYFLTFCTYRRHPHFVMHEHVDVVLEQILRSADDALFAIVAYCFMPDHVHLLLEAQSDASDCRQFIKRAKQFSGYYFKQRFGKPLWQRYGFEHVLRNDEATLSVARYTLENPIRGGLVERVEDYPFAGSPMYPLADILAAVQMMPDNWRRSG
jgi:putative transposase